MICPKIFYSLLLIALIKLAKESNMSENSVLRVSMARDFNSLEEFSKSSLKNIF